MTPRLLRLLVALALGLTAFAATAQRQITPVQPGRPAAPASTEPRRPDMTKLAHYQDEKGGIVLVDTVTGLEYADTLQRRIPANRYPLLHSIAVGVNIWDGAMRIFGQKYGIGDASISVGLHNRYFPTFEAGISTASDTPSGSNFTYTSPMAPYFKIGADYNFFYNSNPDYRLMAGVRYGFTSFRYSVDNVTLDPGYWDEPAEFNIPRQTSTAGYFELMLSLRVKIVGPFHMGWSIKYHTLLHESRSAYGDPMVIPGFGKRSSPITGAFSLFYCFTVNKPAAEAVDITEQSPPGGR